MRGSCSCTWRDENLINVLFNISRYLVTKARTQNFNLLDTFNSEIPDSIWSNTIAIPYRNEMKKVCVLSKLLHSMNILSLCVEGSRFELIADSIALPTTFSTTTAVSVIACCLKCHRVNNCITIGYNIQRRECLLSKTTTLTHGPIHTIEPTGFQIFQGLSFVKMF